MNTRSRMSTAALLLGTLTLPAAQAGLMTPFTGWTEMNDCFVCDTTVSFAVWENTDGNWGDDFNFGITRLDVLNGEPDYGAAYVYLYQVVNTNYNQPQGMPEEPIRDFQVVNYGGSRFTSGGYIDAVFQDSDGPVGTAGNVTLASADFAGDVYNTSGDFSTPQDDPAPDAVADPTRNKTPPSDATPNVSGVVDVGFTADSAGRRPEDLRLRAQEDFNFSPSGGSTPDWQFVVDFNWTMLDTDPNFFEPDSYSPLLFLTSDYAPVYDVGTSRSIDTVGGFPPIPDRDGNTENVWPGANGDLPVPAPLPPTWTLLLPGLWLIRRGRRAANA